MEIGTKVKHIPTGDIVTVTKVNQKTYTGKSTRHSYAKQVRVNKTDCELYIDPPKEKSAYEKMKDRSMDMATKLSPSPKDIGQHILWLKMAVIDRVEKVENLVTSEICTFRSREDGGKFGFTEHYVNLLMHYAYEAGKQNATESLTRSFTEQTNQMKHAIDGIINALDSNNLLPDNNDYY